MSSSFSTSLPIFDALSLLNISQFSKCVVIFAVIQSLSCVWLFVTPWTVARQTSLSFTISQRLLKLMSIGSVIQSNHLILCHPFPLLPSVFPSIRVFSRESSLCIRFPNYWSFSSGISPSNECSRLISFRIDWFDLLAVQGTLKSLLQHHSWKASILWCSAFFTLQLSHPYTTTGKTIALTRWTFVGKVMSLLSLLTPGKHWSFYSLPSCAFSRMSRSCNHICPCIFSSAK